MNTNDFYKQLFEKYALDEEKIRRSAIKEAKTPAWKRTLGGHWKTFAGAAAAVAVTVGAVAYTTANSQNGIDIVTKDNMLSATERLRNIEQDYYNVSSGEDESGTDIYVSFAGCVCYSDMAVSLSAVSDNEDIIVSRLYLENGTVINGIYDIESFAENSSADKCIIGAKLYAPAKYYRDIIRLSSVFAAERGSDQLNDDTFVPLPYKDDDPLNRDYEFISTTASTAASTVTSFSFVGETSTSVTEKSADGTTAAPSVDDTTVPPVVDEIVEDDSTGTDVIVGEDPEESETSPIELDDPDEAPTYSESSVTDADTAVPDVTVSSDEITDAPEIGLISQIYQLNVENAMETVLIGDHAIVLTRSQAYFYVLGGFGSVPQAHVAELSDPKIVYSSEDTVILSGCGSDGLRNAIVVYDLRSGRVYVSNAAENLGSAEIGTIQYSSADHKFFLRAVSASTTYVYEFMIDVENGIQFRPLFEYQGTVSIAACKEGKLWFTASEDSVNYSLYSFDCVSGELTEIRSLGTSCKIRRSPTLESFIIFVTDAETGESTSYVFNVNNSEFISSDIGNDALIAVSGDKIYISLEDKVYYLASDGILTETNSQIEFAAKISSRYSIMSADSERVTVVENNPYSWQ